MKIGFYFGLAKEGIRKNRRLYIPYMLTCICIITMFYILNFLQTTPSLLYMRGNDILQLTLKLGTIVIGIFSVIFLFYTNSFLMKRRKKEFGLLNILGLGKKHLGYILFYENLIVALASLFLGTLFGFLFSKFAELGLLKLLGRQPDYSLSISLKSVLITCIVYGCIFVLIYLNGFRQILFQKTIHLLNSEKTGEKPPKANWFLGLLGFLILGVAYYLAVSQTNALGALTWFFIAVLLVIVATYLLMIAGSVLLCKILQKNKTYYYKTNHFASVSSMLFRMKRNGAGLASICILATMVLVMISSSSCLYFGYEDSLTTNFYREINLSLDMNSAEALSDQTINGLMGKVDETIKTYSTTPTNVYWNRYAYTSGKLEGNTIRTEVDKYNGFNQGAMNGVCTVQFLSLADFNRQYQRDDSLEADQILLISNKKKINLQTLSIQHGNSYRVKESFVFSDYTTEDSILGFTAILIVVPSLEESLGDLVLAKNAWDDFMVSYHFDYCIDTNGLSDEDQIALCKDIKGTLQTLNNDFHFSYYRVDGRAENRQDFFASFGSLFFIGLCLSIVFIFAAVLIIYYKQICEGYEDQSRFEIMQKVGMSKKEIQQSINSQMLTVFFFPLLLAGIHICFAFPMIRQLLTMFSLTNVKLFITTCLISFLIFGALYTCVYKITSKAYYHIVSGQN